MRAVGPLQIEALRPADLAGQPQPDFDLVAPNELLVDDSYQRDLSPKSMALIKRIVENWSWPKFKPPICARVDGKLHVIDGQHTAIAAATHGGITIMPVVVVAAPDLVTRAKAFVSHATQRLPTTPGQVWHAAVAAGDEDALTIKQVCERAGVMLVPYSFANSEFAPRQTIAIAAIRALIVRRGALKARIVLEALAQAELAPISATMIKVADTLLLDDEYRFDMDAEKLVSTLKVFAHRTQEEAKELAAAKCLPMWRALVAVIFKHRVKKSKPDATPTPTAATRPAPAARPLGRLDVRPTPSVPTFGDPAPGRSALDERRRIQA